MARTFVLMTLSATLLSACAGNVTPAPVSPRYITANGEAGQRNVREIVLYSFHGLRAGDGQEPDGPVTADAAGVLYGTTLGGGRYGQGCGSGGCGTVYELTPSGSHYTKSTVYRFRGAGPAANDGAAPIGAVTLGQRKELYGVTYAGGTPKSQGTVFELISNSSGYSETLVHTFPSSQGDGFLPCAGLTMDKTGMLYGTTVLGGAYGQGTVFELKRSGGAYVETVIHSFGNGDGAAPQAALTIDSKGTVYGTTAGGGANCGAVGDNGTVFALVRSGSGYTERVLYRFQGNANGEGPNTSILIGTDGTLYGTTAVGGSGLDDTYHCGTVYELVPKGKAYRFATIYVFRCPDGAGPNGVIAGPNNSLYGTTTSGGKPTSACDRTGCGIVFQLTPSEGRYRERTLWTFLPGLDGHHPFANVIERAGTLYGTTMFGGIWPGAYAGTVFKVSP